MVGYSENKAVTEVLGRHSVSITETVTENKTNIFTDDLTNSAVSLHVGLKALNEKIATLEKSSFLNKAKDAEAALYAARDLMAKNVFTTHALINDHERLKSEVNRILNIGVIKNG